MADSTAQPVVAEPAWTPLTRRALAGFFVSGLLLAFTGTILPTWGHHLRSDYGTVGLYFLSLNAGILLSLRLGQWMLVRNGAGVAMATASGLGCASILFLAAVGPPFAAGWRMAGLAVMGAAAGLLQSGVFLAISPLYQRDRAATANLAGALFGGGCLTMALLVSGTFYVYTAASILILVSVIPGWFALMYARMKYPLRPLPQQLSLAEGLRQFRSPMAILFALLVFFQFGNEWAIAGWLPLFLVQRLGISPAQSLIILALYWVALLVGRLLAQPALARVSHGRLLAGCALAAVLGALVVGLTNNRFGAVTGILLIGGAYAPIFPLVIGTIGDRFPDYHPGFFNGVFSLAFTGGLLAPCSLGLFTEWWGIRAVMGLPLAGTVMVLLLVLAIQAEAWLNKRGTK